MDLNHIELPASVIADLYRDSLIEVNEKPANDKPVKEQVVTGIVETEAVENTSTWKWLGNNGRHILVIVNNEESAGLPDKDLAFLTEILGACKLNLADVAIVNLHNHPGTTYKDLTAFFKSRIVLLFAVEPADFGLPMSFPAYQIQAFANNSFLFSPSLKELGNDRVEKSKLWVCLKRLFNL
ncbi:MAG: hypothetical protein ABIT05_14995 [Chitinophagaceae bacterium]